MSKPTAVIQQIVHVEDNEYQVLFTQVVSAHGIAVIGINVAAQDIKEDDIRVGDKVEIGQNTEGLYIALSETPLRTADSKPFFPPEPEPAGEFLILVVGPFDNRKANTNVAKTLQLTAKGVLNNSGLPGTEVRVGNYCDDAAVHETIENTMELIAVPD